MFMAPASSHRWVTPWKCCLTASRRRTPNDVRFVEALPITVAGKVQKYLLREAMAEELGQAIATP
jgi:acyl-coenzyme A synthetase/AMP-(fatty) acid ligase